MQEQKPFKEAETIIPVVMSDDAPIEGRFEMAPNVASTKEIDYEALTKQIDGREKWINAVLNFIIKRTYAGDWVSHDKMTVPMEERTVNMVGAAAERIARDLGISELNRTKPLKEMDEKHPNHYRYVCEADFVMNRETQNEIRVHAIGIASTLNPFWAKEPDQIREEYILREAWRDCTKQAIKGMLGLRKIPIMKLKELGYDITKVKFVNFKEKDGEAGEANRAATATPPQEMTLLIKHILPRAFKGTDILDVMGTKGEKLSWWGKKLDSVDGKNLQQFAVDGWQVTFKYTQKGEYRNIVEILEAVPQ